MVGPTKWETCKDLGQKFHYEFDNTYGIIHAQCTHIYICVRYMNTLDTQTVLKWKFCGPNITVKVTYIGVVAVYKLGMQPLGRHCRFKFLRHFITAGTWVKCFVFFINIYLFIQVHNTRIAF